MRRDQQICARIAAVGQTTRLSVGARVRLEIREFANLASGNVLQHTADEVVVELFAFGEFRTTRILRGGTRDPGLPVGALSAKPSDELTGLLESRHPSHRPR